MRDAFALGGAPYHFFCEKLAERGGIQYLFGQKLLQLGVLVLKLLQRLASDTSRPLYLAFQL